MESRRLEEELWDDSGSVTPKTYHGSCGGRVYWIGGDEWRCIECGQAVAPTDTVQPEDLFSGDSGGI